MTVEQIAWWWCCQANDTKNSLLGILMLWQTSPFATLKAAFDDVLELFGISDSPERYEWWVNTFQVSFETIIVDDVDVEIVIFNLEFWTNFNLFIVAAGATCAEPCYILKFALHHL